MSVQHEISQRDLRNRSGEIMDAVEHGETFTVTRSGSPIAQLVPLCRRHAVSRDQFATGSANAPLVDPDRFRADLDDALEGEAGDPYGR
ncbi:prevent-host-death protein [Amycolatopsis sp. WAC 01375]|uniref:type II toxin-antitoxin system Phd/YefM family antitoxin n=1 Tax=Amycolatopsis sp. WAC 01375 TaxID=2203194 RepID=UPI000F7A588C|nr:type II toxin-antitoxin system prevent-host-death family antitoxin [Amycolatopsis sp. WAC 01375]RSM80165.1 prevent-host-death protein [Amycolatopsis sp. WAC 01375]